MCDVVIDDKKCHRLPYAEVYNLEENTWCYVCKKHYNELYNRYGDERGWFILPKKEKLFAIFYDVWLHFKDRRR